MCENIYYGKLVKIYINYNIDIKLDDGTIKTLACDPMTFKRLSTLYLSLIDKNKDYFKLMCNTLNDIEYVLDYRLMEQHIYLHRKELGLL